MGVSVIASDYRRIKVTVYRVCDTAISDVVSSIGYGDSLRSAGSRKSKYGFFIGRRATLPFSLTRYIIAQV